MKKANRAVEEKYVGDATAAVDALTSSFYGGYDGNLGAMDLYHLAEAISALTTYAHDRAYDAGHYPYDEAEEVFEEHMENAHGASISAYKEAGGELYNG